MLTGEIAQPAAAAAASAYAQCFGGAPAKTAQRVKMTALRAGDRVLTAADGAPAIFGTGRRGGARCVDGMCRGSSPRAHQGASQRASGGR